MSCSFKRSVECWNWTMNDEFTDRSLFLSPKPLRQVSDFTRRELLITQEWPDGLSFNRFSRRWLRLRNSLSYLQHHQTHDGGDIGLCQSEEAIVPKYVFPICLRTMFWSAFHVPLLFKVSEWRLVNRPWLDYAVHDHLGVRESSKVVIVKVFHHEIALFDTAPADFWLFKESPWYVIGLPASATSWVWTDA